MTKREATDKMLHIANCEDGEVAHSEADDLMCEILKNAGYNELVATFKNMDKWYP